MNPRIARSTRRRAAYGALAWLGTFGFARVAIAQPEQCRAVSRPQLDTAITEAVDWVARTQYDDGHFIYRYDARTNVDLGVYEFVRHAGLTMALYQAAGEGERKALALAQKADTYARGFLQQTGDATALAPAAPGELWDVGASALYLNALIYKHDVAPNESSPDDDALLVGLGHFLVANVAPTGAVAAYWDPATSSPRTDTSSPFYTGETMWALARMERIFPGEWREPATRILHYVATERDDAEGNWPDVPDHWASYAMAEMANWPGPSVVDDRIDAYARHVAELESVAIRYESQRTGAGLSRLTRGDIGLGAGVGALTEALESLRRVPALAGNETLRERSTCAISLLLHRQTSPEAALRYSNPERARGAWIRQGVTQIDDQQHALSALLLYREREATS